ncbi:S8 family serine peptidase [Cesiribacter sp. SM1]|uniref:S8 family serine peptidase n=1 Tax=Cesiribacter sp. SM1 TaxID=2861196 RepID=UPI001CD3229D|nr:S8 family serine peptidase [Cesiribacter sp. SM1]
MRKIIPISLCILLLSVRVIASPLENEKDKVVKGQILVKLKPSFIYLNSDGAGMRTSFWNNLVPDLSIYKSVSFSSKDSKKNGLNQKANRGSGLDLRQYHQLSIDPSIPVDEAIDKLYKSGVVEIAEPDYMVSTNYVPNDPEIPNQYYIDLINAFEGWDITKGSNELVIAILDSGVDLDHPDLANNIYVNENDPVDGVDNDRDGYIDNYYGWDFAGSDKDNYQEDNDPNAELENISHGTMVAGCASAVTDNALGIAGIGFNAKLLVLKHSADNDTDDNGNAYLVNLLQGVTYAAQHGANIINASYGGTVFSQIAQDIYKIAALDYDVLIVAAAGNEGSAQPHYPADYDYVLSVSASTSADTKATFSNYGYKVDIAAPGANIYTTQINGDYGYINGTSFSSPIVAGAAALVKTLYPDFNGAQIGEVLRVTSDPAFNEKLIPTYKDKMGRGRLDVQKALTTQSPSIRFDNSYLESDQGDVAKAGQQAKLYGDFINFLWAAEGVEVTITSLSRYLTVLSESVSIGNLDMMEAFSLRDNPFLIQVSEDAPFNTEVFIRVQYSGNNYTDYQYIKVLVNPSFTSIQNNLVATTIAANGRIGYQDMDQTQGIGFTYNGVNMLFEMGIIMATGNDKLVNSVRSGVNSVDQDFRIISAINRTIPGQISDVDVYGAFDDSNAPVASQLNVRVDYQGFAWHNQQYEKSVVLEYEVINKGEEALNDFYFGLFADWDINQEEGLVGLDKAGWNSETNTGYVYSYGAEKPLFGAIQVLTGDPNYWAIDNDPDLDNNPFGVYDGYTDEEKYQSISSGIGRAEGGINAEGNDVSHTVSSGPYTIPPGDSIRIAFALHGGGSLAEIVASARAMKFIYDSIEDEERSEPVILVEDEVEEPTGLYDEEISNVRIFPNPAERWLDIHVPAVGSSPFSVEIIDLRGKRMKYSTFPAYQENVRIQLPPVPGVYVVSITQDKKRTTKKLIIK